MRLENAHPTIIEAEPIFAHGSRRQGEGIGGKAWMWWFTRPIVEGFLGPAGAGQFAWPETGSVGGQIPLSRCFSHRIGPLGRSDVSS